MLPEDGPLHRILEESGHPALLDHLVEMPGADLTSLLLEVMRLRTAQLTPADIRRRYESSRFVGTGPVDPAPLQKAEARVIGALPDFFEMVTLSPLVPFGTHAVLALVDQNNVVSTVRGTEVAADPTAALALEAARRRQQLLRTNPRASTAVRLAARQRVTRAQRFDTPGVFAHFELVGLVTAGRDSGSLAFERDAALEHARIAIQASLACGASAVEIAMTDFSGGGMSGVTDHVRKTLNGDRIRVSDYPDRPSSGGYYPNTCFKLYATFADARVEFADGGVVDWTAKLLSDRKERLFISGIGLERLAVGSDRL